MNKFLLLPVAALIIFFGAPKAQAASEGMGLFIEPGITYERGNTRTDWPSVFNDSSGESNGLGVMARLGFHVADIVFVGLDTRYSMPNFKDSSVNYSADATQFNWGPVFGVQTPLFGIRVWGSYIAGGWLDPNASGNLNVKIEDAQGYRIGAGLRYLMLSVNLEYEQIKYSKFGVESAGGFNFGSFESVKPKNEAWIVSVSFPFDL